MVVEHNLPTRVLEGRSSSSLARCESTISGDALTTRIERSLQLRFQLLGGHLKRVGLRGAQRLEEPSAGQPGDRR